MCGYGGYLGYLDVRELKLIALIYSTLGQRDMRSFGNDDMSDRANNFELATNNSESENDNESVAEIEQVSNRNLHDVLDRFSFPKPHASAQLQGVTCPVLGRVN